MNYLWINVHSSAGPISFHQPLCTVSGVRCDRAFRSCQVDDCESCVVSVNCAWVRKKPGNCSMEHWVIQPNKMLQHQPKPCCIPMHCSCSNLCSVKRIILLMCRNKLNLGQCTEIKDCVGGRNPPWSPQRSLINWLEPLLWGSFQFYCVPVAGCWATVTFCCACFFCCHFHFAQNLRIKILLAVKKVRGSQPACHDHKFFLSAPFKYAQVRHELSLVPPAI